MLESISQYLTWDLLCKLFGWIILTAAVLFSLEKYSEELEISKIKILVYNIIFWAVILGFAVYMG
ncbi:hypothetical protein HNP93_001351 [Methanococcus maripaludis]|uniref:Uncharacterized protein n=1 Tax=Methanococcus maripaludis TaxID=39152 RepID=A0A7J9P768_METMI|nr:hypothetical protein [Methanococcus maripaludis]MBA2858650.1 hypothetical protein [Methanococcus maripaludis]